MTINEKSIVAIYAAPTLKETLERMEDAPVAVMEPEIQADFLSALRKLKGMDEQTYQELELNDTLLDGFLYIVLDTVKRMREGEGEENAEA